MTIKIISNFFKSINEADMTIMLEKVSKPMSQSRLISFSHSETFSRQDMNW